MGGTVLPLPLAAPDMARQITMTRGYIIEDPSFGVPGEVLWFRNGQAFALGDYLGQKHGRML